MAFQGRRVAGVERSEERTSEPPVPSRSGGSPRSFLAALDPSHPLGPSYRATRKNCCCPKREHMDAYRWGRLARKVAFYLL